MQTFVQEFVLEKCMWSPSETTLDISESQSIFHRSPRNSTLITIQVYASTRYNGPHCFSSGEQALRVPSPPIHLKRLPQAPVLT